MARRKKPESVWVPLGGTSRNYRNSRSGETISRRAYDNLRAKRVGFTNVGEKDRVLARVRNSGWNKSFVRMGTRPTWKQLADIDEVRKRRQALKGAYPDLFRAERDSKDRKLVAPKGPLARLLDDLGIRPYNGAPVGES